MISLDELLGGAKLANLSPTIQASLKLLCERMNRVRTAYAKPMRVTSGLRTMEDHLRIYRTVAARKGIPFDQSKVPMRSNHLFGRAVDISDRDGKLKEWCLANEVLLAEIGLWMEHFDYTPTWVHFQTVAPTSGNRWFVP